MKVDIAKWNENLLQKKKEKVEKGKKETTMILFPEYNNWSKDNSKEIGWSSAKKTRTILKIIGKKFQI